MSEKGRGREGWREGEREREREREGEREREREKERERVHMGAVWCSCKCLGLPILGSRVGGSNPSLGLAVVTLSKSLYPHCSSVPSCKIGTWLWLEWQQKGKNNSTRINTTKNLRSRLDFGCQHHISGAVSESSEFLAWLQE